MITAVVAVAEVVAAAVLGSGGDFKVLLFPPGMFQTTWQDFEAEAGASGLSQCGAIIQSTIRLISKGRLRGPISPFAFASSHFGERC